MIIDDFNQGIGTKELETLKPEIVKILDVKVVKVGKKENKKVCFIVNHSKKVEPIEISSIKWINPKNAKVETVGLWFNLDAEKKIRKGSALATFLIFNEVKTISEIVLKKMELETVLDEKGYLVFKTY